MTPVDSACYNKDTGKASEFRELPRYEGGVVIAIKSDAQRRAVAKYNAENYDRVELRLAAGKKDVVKAHANGRGETLNGFINRAINNQIERDNEGGEQNGD